MSRRASNNDSNENNITELFGKGMDFLNKLSPKQKDELVDSGKDFFNKIKDGLSKSGNKESDDDKKESKSISMGLGKNKKQDDSWTCDCGHINTTKFCGECASPRD